MLIVRAKTLACSSVIRSLHWLCSYTNHRVSSGSFVLYVTMVFVEVVEQVWPGFNVCPDYLPYKKTTECVGETEKLK